MVRKDMGVKLQKSAAKRLLEAGRYVEQQPRNSVPVPAGPADYGGGIVVLLTTNLGRMSGATPGTGSGKIQKKVSGVYSDLAATTYPVVNDTSAQWNSGAYVMCIYAYGELHAINTSCSNVTL